jgi:hypothetical protein
VHRDGNDFEHIHELTFRGFQRAGEEQENNECTPLAPLLTIKDRYQMNARMIWRRPALLLSRRAPPMEKATGAKAWWMSVIRSFLGRMDRLHALPERQSQVATDIARDLQVPMQRSAPAAWGVDDGDLEAAWTGTKTLSRNLEAG